MATWKKYKDYYSEHKDDISVKRRRIRSKEKIQELKEYFKT